MYACDTSATRTGRAVDYPTIPVTDSCFMMLSRNPAADDDGPHRDSTGARPPLSARSAAAVAVIPADRALRQVRAVIDGLPEPILVTDDHDRVCLTNPSADKLFADRPVRDREDLLSRFEPVTLGPANLGPATREPEARGLSARERGTRSTSAATDDPSSRTAVRLDSDGGVAHRLRHEPNRWFSIESFPLGRNDPAQSPIAGEGSVYVLRDVKDQADIRREGDAFLSIMTHELRTPITTIYAGSSVLARTTASLSPPALRSLALDVSAEAARLYDLVEDLIVIARLERQALEPLAEPVLLQRIADVTARVVASRAPDVELVREGITDPPPVRGDATYIEQAARDLALVSARVSAPGQPVALRLDHDESRSEVILRVLDRGPQMSLTERVRVFDLPRDATGARRSGAGVGPFVARRLVESMGGSVWARNRPGGGVETGLALPIDRD
jgi:signal transduction histidine kinase